MKQIHLFSGVGVWVWRGTKISSPRYQQLHLMSDLDDGKYMLACMAEMINAIKNLVRHCEIQKLLGRCRRRRERY